MKAGFVALIGRPNVGKSTLLNQLVGEKISIVSDKPQTTRQRILGILTRPGDQTVFVDTPGVHRPGYRLNERMMDAVYEALKDVDVVVQMIDAAQGYGKGEEYVLKLVGAAGKPVILAVNKVDLINKGRLLPTIDFYRRQFDFADIIPVSAVEGDNLDALVDSIVEQLPESRFLYPDDELTDQSERIMVSEIIREKVLERTRREIPYCAAVQIEEFDESEREHGFVRVHASIIVDKPSQKKIVIGRAGRMVKAIGVAARREIERFLGVRKVFLGLNVRVVPGWRNEDRLLAELGVSRAL